MACTTALLLLGASPGSWLPISSDAGWDSASDSSNALGLFSSAAPPSITDGATVLAPSPYSSTLTDRIQYVSAPGNERAYHIVIAVTTALPSLQANLQTAPEVQWGLPDQFPLGGDNLPPLSSWTWTILHDGNPDTNSWTTKTWDDLFERTISWTNQSFKLVGTPPTTVNVTVDPGTTYGAHATGSGVVLNNPGVIGLLPANESAYISAARALHLKLIRYSTVGADVSLSWNLLTDLPRYNFTSFDRLASFTSAIGAHALLTIPAGTWGDGNILPTGMPLNYSAPVTAPSGTGYLPADGAWVTYVAGIVAQAVLIGAPIKYWSIGNEIPMDNMSVVDSYIHLFNLAAATIHAVLPKALVGMDSMDSPTYLATFAAGAVGVGFLDFHYYPASGICVINGKYCPPEGQPHGTTTRGLFSVPSYSLLNAVYPPAIAQAKWHADTGAWIPVLNTETNLNAAGGSPASAAEGTDPRIQSLIGAAWLGSLLVDGSDQRVADTFYFTFTGPNAVPSTDTGPYGGWGFGLARIAANGATTRFAPYSALQLWGSYIPAGATGWKTTSSSPCVETYAVNTSTGPVVYAVNRCAVPVELATHFASGTYLLSHALTLDNRSYVEDYDPTTGQEVLSSTGFYYRDPGLTAPVLIDGYGVSVLFYGP